MTIATPSLALAQPIGPCGQGTWGAVDALTDFIYRERSKVSHLTRKFIMSSEAAVKPDAADQASERIDGIRSEVTSLLKISWW
jgi:hypothetical protein